MARCTHRKFFQRPRRHTDEGLIEQQRLADRSGLRTWLVRVRACNRVLIASTLGSTSLEIIFRTIEKGVNKAWWHYFGDPTGHFHRTWDETLYVLAGK